MPDLLRVMAAGASVLGAPLGRRTPLKVTHLLTYACNEECGFCTRIHIPSGHMDEGQTLAMMNAFAALGTRWWVWNGGEPTLVKALPRYIARGKELGFHRTMVTNGTFLRRRARELRDLDLVICSIHGDRENHDRTVGLAGAWEQAIDGLRAMADLGVERCLMVVLHKENLGLLDELLRLSEELGAGLACQPITETRLGGAEVDTSLVPAAEAMRAGVDWLLTQKMAGRPVSASPAYLRAVRSSWPDQPFPVPCQAGRLFCEVTPEGYVVPCCAEEEYTFARCHGPTVGWARAFRALPDRSTCRACSFKGPQELNLLLGLSPREIGRATANLARGRLLWD
jgi:MoaA/NifB/PqqE/SkfB family radical SAM enzyme